ncbi:TRAP transporter small permease [Mesorhizobium sp. ASY16-5R]|uniref:TRAP transporter small permease n=1 Tax=Mesorhizobium sp. ASY16-5R TaxID=3445772 RepID=UPI003F9F4270
MSASRSTLRQFGDGLLDPLIEWSRRLSQACAWVGGGIFILSALIITVEVMIRKFLSRSLGGADELSGYGFAVAVTFAFAYASLERAHIRVDTLHAYLSSRWKAFLDVVAALLLLVYFGLLMRYGMRVLADTWEMNAHSNTPLHVPLVVPQSLWLLGLLLTFAVSTLLLARACIHLILGEIRPANRLIGARSMEEEINEELSAFDEEAAAGKVGR